MFWLGGFTFYASIVVPIGQKELGPRQGIITKQVTRYLNLSGAVALVIFAWDLAFVKHCPMRRRLLWICWAGMLSTLALLVYFHGSLTDMMNQAGRSPKNPQSFQSLHSWYLWVSTIQWTVGVVYTFLALGAWRQVDGLPKGI
jgi:hypothetical protein